MNIKPGDMIKIQAEKGSTPMIMEVQAVTLTENWLMLQGVVDSEEITVIADSDTALMIARAS